MVTPLLFLKLFCIKTAAVHLAATSPDIFSSLHNPAGHQPLRLFGITSLWFRGTCSSNRMSVSASTQKSLRRALGALKDTTKVGLAKVSSDYKELDIAIVKATNHVEVLGKEKHISTIFGAFSSSRPRADAVYCMQALAKRLAKTQNWAVAFKTSIVMHCAMREIDATFREELINYSQNRALMLNLFHFKDDSGLNAWNYSVWVRVYASYLEEHLECFRMLRYDIETDRLWRLSISNERTIHDQDENAINRSWKKKACDEVSCHEVPQNHPKGPLRVEPNVIPPFEQYMPEKPEVLQIQ